MLQERVRQSQNRMGRQKMTQAPRSADFLTVPLPYDCILNEFLTESQGNLGYEGPLEVQSLLKAGLTATSDQVAQSCVQLS